MKTVSDRQVLARVSGGAGEKGGGGGITRGEFIAGAGAIGGGLGASKGITAAGGYAALSTTVAIPTLIAAGTGLATSFLGGYAAGTALYEDSTWVQRGSQAVVGGIMDAGNAIGGLFSGGSMSPPASGRIGGKPEDDVVTHASQ